MAGAARKQSVIMIHEALVGDEWVAGRKVFYRSKKDMLAAVNVKFGVDLDYSAIRKANDGCIFDNGILRIHIIKEGK